MEELFHEIEGIEVEYPNGAGSDPELSYRGYNFNYYDIEADLWHDFLEENKIQEEDISHWGANKDLIDPEYEEKFDKYCKDHCKNYLNDCISSIDIERGEQTIREKMIEEDSPAIDHNFTYNGYTYTLYICGQDKNHEDIVSGNYQDSIVDSKCKNAFVEAVLYEDRNHNIRGNGYCGIDEFSLDTKLKDCVKIACEQLDKGLMEYDEGFAFIDKQSRSKDKGGR